MSTVCARCRQSFQVSEADLALYAKASPVIGGKTLAIPAPTLCPPCRQQRRFTWRNERSLYHRKCDLSGKMIISNYHPDEKIHAYEIHDWFSDKWDGRDFGRDFDFGRPFFAQFAELQKEAPQLALSIWNSENSDFCNYIGHVKNSYLIFGSVYSENCYYGSPYYSKDCMDTLVIRECERCYECIDCRKLHTCFYCQDCHSSNDLIYCFDCQGCSECIGCAGLRNQKFRIFNTQYDEATYKKMKKELNLCVPEVHTKLKSELKKMSLAIPHRYMQGNKTENVSGNYIYECKDVHESFYADRSHDCSYCAQVVDLKDCFDNNYTEENELCVEYLGAYQNSRTSFSKFCNQVHDALYCDACHTSKHLFGCIAMRNGEYCILNKQYTKEEYEKLVPKIVEHMRNPSTGSGGEWGEFFDPAISPFGYNETVAQEYFPMEKKQAEKNGWRWRKEEENSESYMGPVADVPQDIAKVDDTICEKILKCEQTGKLFRIIEQELKLLRELKLPIPRICPNARNLNRLAMRNPRRLWDRDCAKCGKALRTSYAPDRPEIVYCDPCYLSTIY